MPITSIIRHRAHIVASTCGVSYIQFHFFFSSGGVHGLHNFTVVGSILTGTKLRNNLVQACAFITEQYILVLVEGR